MELYDGIYLTGEEFLVMSSGAGMDRVEGLFADDIDLTDTKDIIRVLFSLCTRDILKVSGKDERFVFHPSKEAAELFSAIAKASEIRRYYSKDAGRLSAVCYLGDGTVVSEICGHDPGSVRLFFLHTGEEGLKEWAENRGFVREEKELYEGGTIK